ncbi:MAG: aldehyde dehydrogenase family protein [Cytophagales bacterium]|nr:aldehyde dehydrogenase family protein [Cytophagales bacterium]
MYSSQLSFLGIQAQGNPAFSTGQVSGGNGNTVKIKKSSPIDGAFLAEVPMATANDLAQVISIAQDAFDQWKKIPAPQRGEIIRQIGQKLRENKSQLGYLVTLETGKIIQEGLGEVQEMIDICDFACGLSRQIAGLNMPSERTEHRLVEQYHPLGIVGIISAFNFPVAVWAWNAMIGAVCGNVMVWKPSEKTPLTALAVQHLIQGVLSHHSLPEGIFNLVLGDSNVGKQLAEDERIALVSATGSTKMGKAVAGIVANRLGKSLLELGGNNALIVTENADLDLALKATVFGAVGTAGQRCTTTRRLILHEDIYSTFLSRLLKAYASLPIGNPTDSGVLVGPLIDRMAVEDYFAAIQLAESHGAKMLCGGNLVYKGQIGKGNYVVPTIIEATNDNPAVQKETFAPILYVMKYNGSVENAVKLQNNVKQGLSSAIFTERMREMEIFISASGSDCGIANVNAGTSGAEIGGAFGGEKETGGGRESGSDAWKAYMRRVTSVINYSGKLLLAQGILFDL